MSRSATVCIAYLILKEKMNYDDAYKLVKERRGIISPNLGFIIDLNVFYRRLHRPYSEITDYYKPKIFAVGWHQIEDPDTVVARLIKNTTSGSINNGFTFDPRSILIIGNDETGYLWIGNQCDPSYKEIFLAKANEHLLRI